MIVKSLHLKKESQTDRLDGTNWKRTWNCRRPTPQQLQLIHTNKALQKKKKYHKSAEPAACSSALDIKFIFCPFLLSNIDALCCIETFVAGQNGE